MLKRLDTLPAVTTPTRVRVRAARSSVATALPILALWLTLFLAVLPLLVVFANGVGIFDIAHEFVAYRMGQALSLMFRDTDAFVPAVQGLPNAILSKLLARILFAFYGPAITSATALQTYSALFFATVLSLIAVALVCFWHRATWSARAGIALMALLPWHLTPTWMLLAAPDYWIVEYAFLLVSLGLFTHLQERDALSDRAVLLLGAWAGLGLTVKISLLGLAPLLFLASRRKDWVAALLFANGAALAYLVVVALYAGLRPSVFFATLHFQLFFYLKPNVSATYDSALTAFTDNGHLMVILAAAVGLAIAQARRNVAESVAALVWVALLAYLVLKRPHFTSVASASLGGLFLIAYVAGRMRSVTVSGATSLVLMLTPAFVLLPQRQWAHAPPMAQEAMLRASDILFIPDNYWNAATPIQAFAFNGGLALRPVHPDAEGNPSMTAPTFQTLFGPKVILGASERELALLEHGLANGRSVAWTRPATAQGTEPGKLFHILRRLHATIAECEVAYRGGRWLVGRASLAMTGDPVIASTCR